MRDHRVRIYRHLVLGLLTLAGLVLFAGVGTVWRANASPVLHAIPLNQGQYVGGVVVDAQTSRAFVAVQAGTAAGHVLMIDTVTGRLLQTLALSHQAESLAIDRRQGRVFVAGNIGASTTGAISVIDARTGHLLGRSTLPRAVAGMAVDEQKKLLLMPGRVGNTHRIQTYVYNSINLRLMGILPINANAVTAALVGQTHRLSLHELDPTLNASSGAVSIYAPASPLAASADEQTGRAFVVAPNFAPIPANRVFVLDRRGHLLHALPLPNATSAIEVDTHTRHVFVSTMAPLQRQRVFVLNTGSRDDHPMFGTTLETVKAPFVAPGSISVLNASSGAILYTIPVGFNPEAMAVDTRADHAVIIDVGSLGPIPMDNPWGWLPRWLRQRLPWIPSSPNPAHIVPVSILTVNFTR